MEKESPRAPIHVRQLHVRQAKSCNLREKKITAVTRQPRLVYNSASRREIFADANRAGRQRTPVTEKKVRILLKMA